MTIPRNAVVKELMNEFPKPVAESVAVHTALFKERRIIGYNTDGTGFASVLAAKAVLTQSAEDA